MRKLSILLFWLALALAAPLSAKDLWVVPVHAEPVQLNLIWPVTQYGLARFAFGIPDDMSSFASAHVVFIPTATASGSYNLYLQVKRDGEVVSQFDLDAEVNVPVSFTANEVTEVDVSSVFAGVFDSTSRGNDQVSLLVYAPGALLNSARVLGMRFTYDPLPVQTAQLANGVVNSAKVADESLTGTDIQDGSIGTADLANASITSAKIMNGGVSNIDIAPGAVTGPKIATGTILGANIADDTVSAGNLVDETGIEWVGGSQSMQLGPAAQIVRSIDVDAPVTGYVLVQASGSFELQGNNAEVKCGIRADNVLQVPADATLARLGTFGLGSSAELTVPFAATKAIIVKSGITTIWLICDSPQISVKVRNSHLSATFSPTKY